MPTKTCLRCAVAKPIDCFSLANNNRGGDGRAHACIECNAQMTENEKAALVAREWRKRNLAQARANNKRTHVAKKYGITIEEYNALVKAQDSVCAICRETSNSSHPKGKVYDLAVDHNHKTGAVRGLLCRACNHALGLFRENPSYLKAALKYLKKHE